MNKRKKKSIASFCWFASVRGKSSLRPSWNWPQPPLDSAWHYAKLRLIIVHSERTTCQTVQVRFAQLSHHKRQRRQGLAQFPNLVNWRLSTVSVNYVNYFKLWKCLPRMNIFGVLCFVSIIGSILTVLVIKLLKWMGEKRRGSTKRKKQPQENDEGDS